MLKIDWIDVLDIAIELYDKFPEVDPQWISFPDLHQKVCGLENFIGDPKFIGGNNIVATTSKIYKSVLKSIKPYLKL